MPASTGRVLPSKAPSNRVATTMSVHSSTCGARRRTGEDASKFKNQLRYGRPKAEAKAAAVRGKDMMAQFQKQGYVVVKVAKKA